MKILFRLAKKSAKKVFQGLRKQGPYFCKSINKNVRITKLFLSHITNIEKKKRTYFDIIERSFILPFVKDIIEKGILQETRTSDFGKFHKVSLLIGEDTFSIIIIENKKQLLLLSCFRKYQYNEKRDLS